MPGHLRFALRLCPARQINVVQRFPRALRVLAVVDRVLVGERRLLHELVGAGAVEPHPVILPRVGFVGRIGDQLVRLGQEQVAFLQAERRPAHLVHAAPGHHQVDQIMVAHAGAPGVPGAAELMPAIEDGELHVVRVALFIRLFLQLSHASAPVKILPQDSGGTFSLLYQLIHQKSMFSRKKSVYLPAKFVILKL